MLLLVLQLFGLHAPEFGVIVPGALDGSIRFPRRAAIRLSLC